MIFRNITIFLAICSYISMIIVIRGGLATLGWIFLTGFIVFLFTARYFHIEGM